MKILTALFLLGVAGALRAAPPALPDDTRVTLPFPEVRRLLETAARPQPEPAPPPVPATLGRATLVLDYSSVTPTARLTVRVNVLQRGWQSIPLLTTPLSLQEHKPAEAIISRGKEGELLLLTENPGVVDLTLTFFLPAPQADAPPLRFRLPATLGAFLQISGVPAGLRPEIRPGSLLPAAAPLPIAVGDTDFTVMLRRDLPPEPTTWSVTQTALAREEADRIAVEVRACLQGPDGDGLAAGLELPPSATDLQLSGPDLAPSEGTTLRWLTPGLRTRTVILRYNLPRPGDDPAWTVQLPRFAGRPDPASSLVLVPADGSVLSNLPPVEPAGLPAWMQPALDQGGLPGRVPLPAEALIVSTRRLPRVTTDSARVPAAEFRTRIEPNGSRLTEGRILLTHRGPLRWNIRLPDKSELLTLEVDGQSTAPVLRTDGLEIPAPGAPGDSNQTAITLSYLERAERIAPVAGRLHLTLPRTPLFIEEVRWIIALPKGYEAAAYEGSMQPLGSSGDPSFQQRLLRDESPTVEIHYRKTEPNK